MKHILFSHSKYAALLCMLLILPAWFSPAAAQARKTQPRRVDVSVAVVTPDGKPVPNADFTVGEGARHLRADEAGRIVFSVAPRDLVTVSAEGFTPVRALGSALAESAQVTLTPAVLLAGEGDDIPLPYTTLKKRWSVGSSIVIRGEELEKYSSTDIRNALTGLASGVEVAEKFGGPGVNPLEHIGQYGASTRISVTTRGKQMMYMVDDIPVQIDETPLDPQQIESITIVRDVLEKSLYGPSAANGIVYIKTKRGRYNDRYLTVDVEGGVNTVDRMPEYVSGADYARLNNIARNNSGLDMLYSRDDVAAYAKNDPYDKWNPSVNFRDRMLKNTMYYTKANVSSGGGNDLVRYFAFLGYAGEDDIYKIGPAANYNRVNINANLDIKLHRYIRARFGLVSTMGIRKSSNYGYSSNYSSEDASSNRYLISAWQRRDQISPNDRAIQATAQQEYEEFIASLEEKEQSGEKQYTSYKPKKVESIPVILASFNPNTADSITFRHLGLPAWMTKNILHYRAKGGKFRKTEDFKKIYGMTEDQYSVLSPYIHIPPEDTVRHTPQLYITETVPVENIKYKTGTILDLNCADTTELKKIPGIGSGIARLIVGYRQRLGGFYQIEQLKDINLDTRQLQAWFSIDPTNG